MHTAQTANETLNLLWNNYLTLCEQVDLESMPPDTLDLHIKRNSPLRPFRIATWLARQGYFIAAWGLWEYYARNLCKMLPTKTPKKKRESTVQWVARSLAASNAPFAEGQWFVGANALRNLIAHSGARVDLSRVDSQLARARTAFPNMEACSDGYVDLLHEHMAELQLKIEDFIHETAQRVGQPLPDAMEENAISAASGGG